MSATRSCEARASGGENHRGSPLCKRLRACRAGGAAKDSAQGIALGNGAASVWSIGGPLRPIERGKRRDVALGIDNRRCPCLLESRCLRRQYTLARRDVHGEEGIFVRFENVERRPWPGIDLQ